MKIKEHFKEVAIAMKYMRKQEAFDGSQQSQQAILVLRQSKILRELRNTRQNSGTTDNLCDGKQLQYTVK